MRDAELGQVRDELGRARERHLPAELQAVRGAEAHARAAGEHERAVHELQRLARGQRCALPSASPVAAVSKTI